MHILGAWFYMQAVLQPLCSQQLDQMKQAVRSHERFNNLQLVTESRNTRILQNSHLITCLLTVCILIIKPKDWFSLKFWKSLVPEYPVYKSSLEFVTNWFSNFRNNFLPKARSRCSAGIYFVQCISGNPFPVQFLKCDIEKHKTYRIALDLVRLANVLLLGASFSSSFS